MEIKYSHSTARTPQDLVALTEELAALSRTHKNSPNDGGNLQRKEILRLTRQINDEVQDARDRNEEYQEQMEEIGALRLLVDWRRAFDHIPRHPETISYSELACRVDAEEPSASPNGMDARVKRRSEAGGGGSCGSYEVLRDFCDRRSQGRLVQACVSA